MNKHCLACHGCLSLPAWKKRSVAALLLLAVGTSAAHAQSEGVPQALARLNATLNSLIATVNQLASRVTQLADALAAPSAAVLVTSPLQAGANLNQGDPNLLRNDRFICQVHNAGTTAAQVTTKILDFAGKVVKTSDEMIAPGAISTTNEQSGIFVCMFTSSTGQLKQLRANAMVRARETGSTIATAEAR